MVTVIACWAPHLLPWLALVAVAVVALHKSAYGPCKPCGTRRTPKCGCPGGSPDQPRVRRPEWPKDPREKK
jgi:hypothetical protein